MDARIYLRSLFNLKEIFKTTVHCTVIFILLLTGTSSAKDTSFDNDSIAHSDVKKYNFILIGGFHIGVGNYENVTSQRGDTPNTLEIGSSCTNQGLEAGIGFRSLLMTYDVEYLVSPWGTSTDNTRSASRLLQRIILCCQISTRNFQFIPEGGYVYIKEESKQNRYIERYNDQNYTYGLSARQRLLPIAKAGLWLYGRYVHDNLDIIADNYWFGLQLGSPDIEIPRSDKWKPYMKSAYFGLIVSWTKRTDGRSDWFLSFSFSTAFGMF
jgi:hypothetical protein